MGVARRERANSAPRAFGVLLKQRHYPNDPLPDTAGLSRPFLAKVLIKESTGIDPFTIRP